MSEAPLVISFYTENTPYQLEIHVTRIASCNEHGIEAEIEGIPSEGSVGAQLRLKLNLFTSAKS